jgi:replicative DNA helicase
VYAELVKRAALRRNLAQVARKVFTLASDETRPYEEIETEALATIESAQRQDGYTTVSLKAALNGVLDALENPVRAAVCPLGFRDLDDLVKPQAEKLILWGGAPGMGKSAMLLCAALNAAKQGKVIFFCTMEMSVSEITQRALAMESGVPYRRLQYEELSGWEMSKVMEAAGRMSNYRLFFDDTAGNRMTPQLLRAKCKRVKGREGRLDAVFVDYIQLMNGKTKTTQTREQEVSEIGKALKNLAKDLRTPIHAVAALNRSLSDRKDKRPQLSDLRESGALEYDADTVIFLYRDVVYNDMSEFPNQADVIVAKNRNGAIGTVSLYFEKTLTKFMDGQARQVDFNNVNWTSDETEANYVH